MSDQEPIEYEPYEPYEPDELPFDEHEDWAPLGYHDAEPVAYDEDDGVA